jgi:uncharacterized protein YjbJ (UPF0337 family)
MRGLEAFVDPSYIHSSLNFAAKLRRRLFPGKDADAKADAWLSAGVRLAVSPAAEWNLRHLRALLRGASRKRSGRGNRAQPRSFDMDKDRIEGSAEQLKGKVKEVVGKVTGDSKTEAEGKTEQVKGKVQNAVGGVKDAIRENTK